MSEEIQAISQGNYILATQQEVSHDNSLSGNGTVDSPLGVVPGYNETVLWENTNTGVYSGTITLNEPWSGFDKIGIEVTDAFGWGGKCENFDTINLAGNRVKHFVCSYQFLVTGSPNKQYIRGCQLEFANNEFTSGNVMSIETVFTPASTITCVTGGSGPRITRVVGINRKQ